MSQSDPFEPLRRAGLIAVIRATQPQDAVQIAGALLAGGIPAVELTFSTPGAAEALAEVRRTYGEDVLIGAGTIREPAQVERAVRAGATFLVTAHLRLDILSAMLATGLPAVPGVFTPSEVAQALDAGAQAVKLFPASTGGPRHLRALHGPFPGLRVIPTGGIGVDDLPGWFGAGALAVGIGSELAPRELVQEGRWQEITRLAERFTAAARASQASAKGAVSS
jgi:2-dehydro-3-deoxyphosphogluconate aldolase/(4S)-4-hydroxy-2-oxoglutarate aldolase